MGKTKEYEAKSTQEALDKAVTDTGIPLSELKFEILSQGGSGIFGLSLKKAKIKVNLPDKNEGRGPAEVKKDRKPNNRPSHKAQPAEDREKQTGRSRPADGPDKAEEDRQARKSADNKRRRTTRKPPRPKQAPAPARDQQVQPAKEQPVPPEMSQAIQPVQPEKKPPVSLPAEPKTPAIPEPPRSTWASPGAAKPIPEPIPEPEPEEIEVPVEAVAPAPEPVEEPVPEEEKPQPTGWAAPSRAKPLPAKEHKEIDLQSIVHQPRLRPTGRVDVDLTSAEFNGNNRSRGRGGRDTRPRRDDRPRREDRFSRDSNAESDRGSSRDGNRESSYDRPRRDDSYHDHMPRQPKSGPAEPYSPKVTDPNASTDYERTEMDQENLKWGQVQLVGLLELVVGETKVDASWVEEKMYLNIIGDGSGLLIGRKGQTLDALQFVMGKMVDKHTGRHYRLMVDTEGYRGRREDSLIEQANILAEKVINGGRPARTGPLNPHERRIIHLALMENEKVRTGSQGEGTYKRVVVSLKRG